MKMKKLSPPRISVSLYQIVVNIRRAEAPVNALTQESRSFEPLTRKLAVKLFSDLFCDVQDMTSDLTDDLVNPIFGKSRPACSRTTLNQISRGGANGFAVSF
jgi:hypothetical protein